MTSTNLSYEQSEQITGGLDSDLAALLLLKLLGRLPQVLHELHHSRGRAGGQHRQQTLDGGDPGGCPGVDGAPELCDGYRDVVRHRICLKIPRYFNLVG